MRMSDKKDVMRFFKKLVIVCAFLVLWSILGLIVYGEQIQRTSVADYIDELEILKRTDGQKAVFIGGSSTGKGIRADMFEQATGIASVNVSASAGTSFNLLIESVKPYLNEGDYLFIAPEYNYYSSDYDSISSETNINFLLYLNPSARDSVSAGEYLLAAPSLITTGWTDWGNYTQEAIKERLFGNSFGIYNRGSIDDHGDTVSHKGLSTRGDIVPIAVDYDDNGFLDALSSECRELSVVGINIILLYPPFEETSCEESERDIDEIATQVSYFAAGGGGLLCCVI
jgi:hypothetical protein